MENDITPVPMPDYPPTPPVKKNRTNAYIIGSAVIAIAAIVTAGVIVSNSRGSDEAAPTPTATVTVTETAAAPEAGAESAEQDAEFKTGEEARNGGANVKITKVTTSDTITLAGAQKKAGADAKYVTVKSVVTNEAKSSMDLTCSLPINNALIDDQGRQFDTIDDLYEVAGNPECNAQLQPGFKDEMLWVYRVPKDAKIASWEFSEYDLENEPTPTLIDLT
ncbi:hypothetical protein ABZT43_12355 [Streptomyces sp. NPDC005349]|uniref:hypothetical protein n=1 Tax=Streptomyces sp. NPDC005349 TaxID=3157037 RepID=UPI0033B82097